VADQPSTPSTSPTQSYWPQAQLYGRDTAPNPGKARAKADPVTLPPQLQRLYNSLTRALTHLKARGLHWLQALAHLEHSLIATPFHRLESWIVSQSDPTQKQMEQLNTLVPATIRLGLLGTIAVVMWWTWPSSQLPPTLMARLERANGQSSTQLRTLAIVSAASLANNIAGNRAEMQAPAGQADVVSLVLRPTPEPDAAAIASADVALAAAAIAEVAVPVDAANAILVPTSTAAHVVMPPIITVVPQVRVLPGVTLKRSLTPEPPTPTPSPTPTLPPVNLNPGRLWSTFAPQAAPNNDHFWVGRPFGDYATNQLASPSYQFGSTAGNRYRTHHGMDISNPFGTPVLSGTDGEVVHAGLDDTVLLGPYNNFFGNTVVIRLNRQLPVANGQLDVYLLYGHLSQVNVSVGQKVRPEDVIGAVGMTGIAIGPHLHVEIRLGSNSYYNNVNPYLWVAPLEGQGAVAVRVLTADGRTWPAAIISVVRFSGGVAAWARQIITYMDTENIGPDPAWGENGAMDGVPAGSYYVVGVVNGERVSAEVTVRAGETTFIELRTKQ
jgi:murein DD-endopeptidase MepM/ murein hydrolase activator NlpD